MHTAIIRKVHSSSGRNLTSYSSGTLFGFLQSKLNKRVLYLCVVVVNQLLLQGSHVEAGDTCMVIIAFTTTGNKEKDIPEPYELWG